ncbi:sugar ABC transporter substrate-binding protein [Pseudoxanthobacter sp. M-2]|uniref:sugar ABC transporter substrate-binding protein n=1 Tax=Pseudoxanthobacter sp. M-2 TaxID=3078754 RepID=UPI0038FC3F35
MHSLFSCKIGLLATAAVLMSIAPVAAAETYNPACFVPAPNAKTIQTEAKPGPYRIALVNGFVGNDWRINMIQAAKAWAALPENKADLKEFKIISVGNDVAAQISALDNLIGAGYDGIVLNAVNATSFGPIVKRAKRAGVALVAFDNVLDTDEIVQVNEDQFQLGEIKAKDVVERLKGKENPKVLEVRGLPGNSVDRDNHDGMRSVLDKVPGIQVTEVVGNWDTGTVQKVVADVLATQGQFDGVVCQHGCAGVVRALIDAKMPMIPIAGDAENGTRIIMAEQKVQGLSAAQAPAMSAVTMQALIAQLKGEPMPSLVSLAIPAIKTEELKDGVNYWTSLPNTFYAATSFPACGIDFTAEQIMSQTPDNT